MAIDSLRRLTQVPGSELQKAILNLQANWQENLSKPLPTGSFFSGSSETNGQMILNSCESLLEFIPPDVKMFLGVSPEQISSIRGFKQITQIGIEPNSFIISGNLPGNILGGVHIWAVTGPNLTLPRGANPNDYRASISLTRELRPDGKDSLDDLMKYNPTPAGFHLATAEEIKTKLSQFPQYSEVPNSGRFQGVKTLREAVARFVIDNRHSIPRIVYEVQDKDPAGDSVRVSKILQGKRGPILKQLWQTSDYWIKD